MKHDYKKFELSDDVCKYIEEIAYMIPLDMDIVIEIHCPPVDKQTQEKMIKAIKNNYGMEIDDVNYDINKVNVKSIIFGFIGTDLFAEIGQYCNCLKIKKTNIEQTQEQVNELMGRVSYIEENEDL